MNNCSAVCWTPVPCPDCGNALPPRGRSVAMATTPPTCCMEYRDTIGNRRHLWDEHDSTRHYTDPDGWAAHVAACETCR
jgi:hypothetical protein